MDHDSLAALFRRIVIAGAPLLSACSSNGYCPRDIEMTYPAPAVPTDAATPDGSAADLISRCQAAASDCTALCEHVIGRSPDGYVLKECGLVTTDDGPAVHVVYAPKCVGGRSPECLAAPALTAASSPLGAWMAMCAHLEEASIAAFDILAAELAAHGSPRALIAASRAAVRDERRHARVMSRLAAQHGAVAPRPRVTHGPIRDLETIARENAIEGCTRETYAALVATRQALTAADPEIRAAMARIARDETRHASLAFAVDAWAATQLAPAARRRVREARDEASGRLLAEASAALPPASLARAGLPDQEEAAQMMAALRAHLPS